MGVYCVVSCARATANARSAHTAVSLFFRILRLHHATYGIRAGLNMDGTPTPETRLCTNHTTFQRQTIEKVFQIDNTGWHAASSPLSHLLEYVENVQQPRQGGCEQPRMPGDQTAQCTNFTLKVGK